MMVGMPDILNASILIVDDQESNVSLLEQLLRATGSTRMASTMNPQEVCEVHRKNCYDLILLDLQMPGMDGFHVMVGLKTNESDSYLPVIVLTAQPATSIRRNLLRRRQCFPALNKPATRIAAEPVRR